MSVAGDEAGSRTAARSPAGASLRKSALALALTLIATLSIAVPSVAAVTGGAKVVIIVGATEGTTASAYRQDADEIVRDRDPVHLQRREGLQPERDLGEGQGGGRRRIGRDLPGSRQRLAEPVYLRPVVQDEGRVRVEQCRGRRRQQPRLLRRAVHLDAPVRTRRRGDPRTTCATRPGNSEPWRRRADHRRRPAARRQLRRGVPQGRCSSRHRRRSPRHQRLYPRPLHDQPDDRVAVGEPGRLERQHRVVPVDADAGGDGLPGSADPDVGLLPIARRTHREPAEHRHRRRRRGRYQRRPRDPHRSGQRVRVDGRHEPLRRSEPRVDARSDAPGRDAPARRRRAGRRLRAGDAARPGPGPGRSDDRRLCRGRQPARPATARRPP